MATHFSLFSMLCSQNYQSEIPASRHINTRFRTTYVSDAGQYIKFVRREDAELPNWYAVVATTADHCAWCTQG